MRLQLALNVRNLDEAMPHRSLLRPDRMKPKHLTTPWRLRVLALKGKRNVQHQREPDPQRHCLHQQTSTQSRQDAKPQRASPV